MPRIRTVKPEMPEDEKLGQVSRDARLTFMLLITRCDDHGRFRAAYPLLRGSLFPYDDDVTAKDVEAWVGELVDLGMVRLYRKDGETFGCLVNWAKHQRIDNAARSNLPAPDEADPPQPAETRGEPPRTAADPQPAGEARGEPPLEVDLDLEVEVDLDREGSAEGNPTTALTLVGEQGVAQAPPDPVVVVFDAWRESTGKHRAQLDSKRRKVIREALKAYPLEDVLAAVRGWRHSAHHRGENRQRTVYNDLGLLLRDAPHIEMFRDLELDGPPQVASSRYAALLAMAGEQ